MKQCLSLRVRKISCPLKVFFCFNPRSPLRALRPLNCPSPLISSIIKELNHYQINLQHLQYGRSESGDRRQKTGDWRQEIGDTGDGRQKTGDGWQKTRHRRREKEEEMGDGGHEAEARRQEMGDRRRETVYRTNETGGYLWRLSEKFCTYNLL